MPKTRSAKNKQNVQNKQRNVQNVQKKLKNKPGDCVNKYAHQIKHLLEKTNFQVEVKWYYSHKNFFEPEIQLMAFESLKNLYRSPISRFQFPTAYLSFNHERDEVELSLMMKHGIEQRKKDVEMLRKHGITKECSINLMKNNVVYDWSYMGVYEKLDVNNIETHIEKLQSYALEGVESRLVRRNEAMARINQIEVENKGKYIMRHQLDYEILINISNYFELMFEFLEKDNLQSFEEHYKGINFESWLSNDMREVESKIQRFDDYLRAYNQWKLNDGWILVDDEAELREIHSKLFIYHTNVLYVVEKSLVHLNHNSNEYLTKRLELVQNYLNQWLSNQLPPMIHYKTLLLTYEKFKSTNIRSIILHHLKDRKVRLEQQFLSFETALRKYYNTLINSQKLSNKIEFPDGTSADDYFLPTDKDRVSEDVEEFNEEDERQFLEEVSKIKGDDEVEGNDEMVEKSRADESERSRNESVEREVEALRRSQNLIQLEDLETSQEQPCLVEYQKSTSSEEPMLDDFESEEETDPKQLTPSVHTEDSSQSSTSGSESEGQQSSPETEGTPDPTQLYNSPNIQPEDSQMEGQQSSPVTSTQPCSPIRVAAQSSNNSDEPHVENVIVEYLPPIQVEEINTSNIEPTRNDSSESLHTNSPATPATPFFNTTSSEDEVTTVIHRRRITPRGRTNRLSFGLATNSVENFQDIVDHIVDVNPDSPIQNVLSNSTPVQTIKAVLQRRLSLRSSAKRSNDRGGVNQRVTSTPGTSTRRQTRYLTREETLERATFNGMSPSIR